MEQLGIDADRAVEMLKQTGSHAAALALAREMSGKPAHRDGV